MNFKLHNKIEITTKNKNLVAFNTLLKGVFTKISHLEEYTSRIAIGNGTENVSFNNSKMSNFVSSFEATTEEICSDVSKEKLFIKKLVSFDESDQSTFSFCEIGLCSSEGDNPDIYNHVLLKNEDDEIVTVTKNPGDFLQIRVTIFLELESESTVKFYKGENMLIKQILGENLQLSDKNIYAVKGEYLADNNPENFRPVPEILDDTKTCSLSLTETEDGNLTLQISAKLGAGETDEIVLVFANQVCLRENIQEILQPTTHNETISKDSDNVVEIGKNIKEISEVKNSESEILEDIKIVKYGTKITDKTTDVFDTTFSSNDKRFVSKDGNKILFFKDNQSYLYEYENCEFRRIFCTLPTNVLNVCIDQNLIVCVLTQSPYVRIFEISNNQVFEKNVSLGNFNTTSLTYEWKSAECVLTKNCDILIGIIANDSTSTAFALKLTKNSSGTFIDTVIRTNYNRADTIITISNSNYTENAIVFITTEYDDDEFFGMEKVTQNGTAEFVATSEQAFMLSNNKKKISANGRLIVLTRQDNSSKFFYLPTYSISNFNVPSNVTHILSFDGDYLILKNDNSFTLYNSHRKDNLSEFEAGYKSIIQETTATDFEFVADKILVFSSNTSEPLYAVTIKKNMTRFDNFDEENANISYSKFNIIGIRKDEGVKIDLTLSFDVT